jgi:hypothetical protein
MNKFATPALIGLAYAQTTATTTTTATVTSAPTYIDSLPQTKNLTDEQQRVVGTFTWFTRQQNSTDGKTITNHVFIQCKPQLPDGKPYVLADYADREFQCMAGPISPKNGGSDMADWCRMRIKVKAADKKFEKSESKDGNLKGWEARGGNDKWNFDDNEGTNQNCLWDDTRTTLAINGTNFAPVVAWSRQFNTQDTNGDFVFKYNKFMNESLSVFWTLTAKDINARGKFDGFFLDDPANSVLSSGASMLVATAIGAATLAANLF